MSSAVFWKSPPWRHLNAVPQVNCSTRLVHWQQNSCLRRLSVCAEQTAGTRWLIADVLSRFVRCEQTIISTELKRRSHELNWTRVRKHIQAGVKLGGKIPPDLRSGTSSLRSTTSNIRSCTSQLRTGTFLLGSTTLLGRIHCNVVTVILLFALSLQVASVKHYLNAIKAKQSALNARKPLVGGREPHLCSRLFRLELRPFKPRAYRDPPPIAE